AKEKIEIMKSECPTVNSSGYEEELASQEAKLKELSSQANSKEDAIEFIKEADRDLVNVADASFDFVGQNIVKGKGEKFFEVVTKANWKERKVKIEEFMAKYPDMIREGYEGSSEYNHFMGFPGIMAKNFSETYKQQINFAIEQAYEEKSKGRLADAKATAESVQKYCEGLNVFLAGISEFDKLKKDADNTANKMGAAQGTAVFTSDYHKQNVGKILFSKSPIEIKKENPSAMTNDFKCSDNIWGIMYFKDSFKNMSFSNSFECNQYIKVDGKEVATYAFKMKPENLEETFLTTEIIVPPDKAKTNGIKTYVKGLSTISPRTHTIEVILQIHFETVAKGEFTLDCSDGVEPIEKINNDFANAAFKSIVMPQPAKRDAKLEAEMLKAMSDWPETPLKAVIIDEDWTINRNAFGVIEYRSIGAAVAFKTTDGKCRLFWLTFKQMYNGSSYGKTQSHAVGDSDDMPCENVK
ncbi:MAG: hypothetical protein QG635_2299, partial [Bacteroidota bacterium]|nr:hypothetical protein [Bacteroidota bacterium]